MEAVLALIVLIVLRLGVPIAALLGIGALVERRRAAR
jgi:hypothetical protein